MEGIQNSLNGMLKKLHQINPKIQIIWTISPVRHQKDGLVENQRSKSHLFVALHAVLDLNKDMHQYYFPSYELLMDELRDYRFYANDMLHPSEIAIEFIWRKFSNHFIHISSFDLMKKFYCLKTTLHHKPSNPDSKEYAKLVKDMKLKGNELRLILKDFKNKK